MNPENCHDDSGDNEDFTKREKIWLLISMTIGLILFWNLGDMRFFLPVGMLLGMVVGWILFFLGVWLFGAFYPDSSESDIKKEHERLLSANRKLRKLERGK